MVTDVHRSEERREASSESWWGEQERRRALIARRVLLHAPLDALNASKPIKVVT